jgi:hypothetical protein
MFPEAVNRRFLRRPDERRLFYRRIENHPQDHSHLELTFEAARPPPPRVVRQELLLAAGESSEYF